MKVLITDNRVIATALDNYAVQGWEQDVLDAPDGLTVANMHEWIYADGTLTYPLAAILRAERNALLAASDWTQVDDAPADKAAWATYRQSLRDITAQDGFPESITWPAKPE
jgi:hypothetical protein